MDLLQLETHFVPFSAAGTLGCVSGAAYGSVPAGANVVGTVLASGMRDDNIWNNGTNVFENGLMDIKAEHYYIVKIDCA